MDRYSRAYTRLCGFSYTADKGGGTGGGEQPTLKQQLEAAEKAKLDAETKLKDAEQKATDLEADAKAATEKATELESQVNELKGQLKAATEKSTELEASAKTADELATEKAAAAGVPPAKKAEDAPKGGASADGKTLFAEYQKLMNDGDGTEASAFWDKNETALMAYAATKEARGN